MITEPEENKDTLNYKSKLARKQIFNTQAYLDRVYDQCDNSRAEHRYEDISPTRLKRHYTISRKLTKSNLFINEST